MFDILLRPSQTRSHVRCICSDASLSAVQVRETEKGRASTGENVRTQHAGLEMWKTK